MQGIRIASNVQSVQILSFSNKNFPESATIITFHLLPPSVILTDISALWSLLLAAFWPHLLVSCGQWLLTEFHERFNLILALTTPRVLLWPCTYHTHFHNVSLCAQQPQYQISPNNSPGDSNIRRLGTS